MMQLPAVVKLVDAVYSVLSALKSDALFFLETVRPR